MATINERQSKVQPRQFTHCIWTKMAPVPKKCKSGADARSTKHQSNTDHIKYGGGVIPALRSRLASVERTKRLATQGLTINRPCACSPLIEGPKSW